MHPHSELGNILWVYLNQQSDDSKAVSDEEDTDEDENPEKVCLTFSGK